MTVFSDLPGAAPADGAPVRRKSPVAIPWRDIACRLAEGAKPAAIAGDLGLKEERIWRHLRQSLRFRFYLRQAIERQRMLAGLQLAALGQTALLSRGLNPESLDGELLRLLHEVAPAEGDLAKQIERLGETGERPPNMAFRARMAAERKRMDAEFNETRQLVQAWKASGAARSDADTGEAVRSATNASEAARSVANSSEPERVQTERGEPERSVAPPPSRLSRAGARPYMDIDGPDLQRLRAAGLLSPGGDGDSG